MWRWLFDIDSDGRRSRPHAPVDHPLLLLPAELRRLRTGSATRCRCASSMSAPPSLAAPLGRRHDRHGRQDAFCAWNDGRERLAEGRCARTPADADLALDVGALGSVYLGGCHVPGDLQRAGRIEGLARGRCSAGGRAVPFTDGAPRGARRFSRPLQSGPTGAVSSVGRAPASTSWGSLVRPGHSFAYLFQGDSRRHQPTTGTGSNSPAGTSENGRPKRLIVRHRQPSLRDCA